MGHRFQNLRRRFTGSIGSVFALAFFARLLAADLLEISLRIKDAARICLYPDTLLYWQLARTISAHALYQVVEWNDIPHFALRAPGYPVFLAICQFLGGDSPLVARLVQALLGAACIPLLALLSRHVGDPDHSPQVQSQSYVAAILLSLHPYAVAGSVILLSEAVFVPLMLLGLWGFAVIWNGVDRRRVWQAFGTGLAAGSAILVRPSWAIYPVILVGFMVLLGRLNRRVILAGSGVCVGVAAVMAPWWIRNERIYGRFVPTALWMGASLYDGLSPRATGASDMSFLADEDIWPLDEEDQDAALRDRAIAFAQSHPGRALELAAIKARLYWTPWPQAGGRLGWLVLILGAIVELPLWFLAGWELWRKRKDLRVWLLLAGPILYFCAVHLVFASSMRYRLPAEPPVLILAAGGMVRLVRTDQDRGAGA